MVPLMRPRSRDASALATELRITLGRIGRRFAQLYAEAGTASGLAFTEASVLMRLEREGSRSPSDLARLENVTPQAVGSVISALEAEGLVARNPDPVDGRKVIVEITREGRRAFDARARSLTEHLERVLDQDLSATERRQLAAILPLLERIGKEL